MNKIGLILLFLIFLCANSSAQEKEFVIRGQIPGMRDSIEGADVMHVDNN